MRAVRQQSSHLPATVVLAAILGLTFVLRMKFWNQPFQVGQGVYGYIGWGILDGLVPYRDGFDHKPPDIYRLYSLVFLLSEPSALKVKVFAAIYALGTALAVFMAALRVAGTRAGFLALKQYLNQNYHKETDGELDKLKEIFAFEIYRRKEG